MNKLEVSKSLGLMNWYEAVEACKSLGRGWRLPTKDELNMLYENKDIIGLGSFRIDYYWSSTEGGNPSALEGSVIAWRKDFRHGNKGFDYKHFTHYARAVREL
jgi:hypothetical protein